MESRRALLRCALLAAAGLAAACGGAVDGGAPPPAPAEAPAAGGGPIVAQDPAVPVRVPEGSPLVLTSVSKPFAILLRYRSMEGPYEDRSMRLDECDLSPPPAAPATGTRAAPELWWWKGATVELLDDAGRSLGNEYMCHLNIDVRSSERRDAFPGTLQRIGRLLTLTQGEMRFELPAGYGLPVRSDETWRVTFQVLNRNKDVPIAVRQRLRLFFVRDRDLARPIEAVAWIAPFISLPIEGPMAAGAKADAERCPCCTPLPRGVNAPNNTRNGIWQDGKGRTLSGHFVVPPGANEWRFPVGMHYAGFPPADARLRATWSHVHPFCESLRLLVHEEGCASPRTVVETRVASEVGSVGLRAIASFSSAEGAALPPGSYELSVRYVNPTDTPQDSMATLGIFYDDTTFRRPEWAKVFSVNGMIKDDASCGTPIPEGSEAGAHDAPPAAPPEGSGEAGATN